MEDFLEPFRCWNVEGGIRQPYAACDRAVIVYPPLVPPSTFVPSAIRLPDDIECVHWSDCKDHGGDMDYEMVGRLLCGYYFHYKALSSHSGFENVGTGCMSLLLAESLEEIVNFSLTNASRALYESKK